MSDLFEHLLIHLDFFKIALMVSWPESIQDRKTGRAQGIGFEDLCVGVELKDLTIDPAESDRLAFDDFDYDFVRQHPLDDCIANPRKFFDAFANLVQIDAKYIDA